MNVEAHHKSVRIKEYTAKHDSSPAPGAQRYSPHEYVTRLVNEFIIIYD